MSDKKVNRMALIGFLSTLIPIVPFLGLVLCTKAWYDCDDSGEGGKGFATAGLILGWLEALALVGVLVVWAYRVWARKAGLV